MEITKKEAFTLTQALAVLAAEQKVQKVTFSAELTNVFVRLEEFLTEEDVKPRTSGEEEADEQCQCQQCVAYPKLITRAELLDLKPLKLQGGAMLEFDTDMYGAFVTTLDGFSTEHVDFICRVTSGIDVHDADDDILHTYNVDKFPDAWINMLPLNKTVKVIP